MRSNSRADDRLKQRCAASNLSGGHSDASASTMICRIV
jgi:hypothetical protein